MNCQIVNPYIIEYNLRTLKVNIHAIYCGMGLLRRNGWRLGRPILSVDGSVWRCH